MPDIHLAILKFVNGKALHDKKMYDVELINVTKKFENTVAVRNLSLQVRKSEFMFLLGPSGCGKTTTLKMIGGLLEPTEGTIKLAGKIINGVPPYKRDTATVFQTWALFPHKNVYDNIAFGLKMRRVQKDETKKRVKRFLELVRLQGYENRMPSQLSGGEQQRVALARALIVEPTVLLLDEPLSNLDLKLRQEMRVEIRLIQEKLNVTTIFVTHDQTEALCLADRIAVMNNGMIEQIGTPIEVFENPETEFVAGFMGEANFFYGKVSLVNNSTAIVTTTSGLSLMVPNKIGLTKGSNVSISVRPVDIEIFEGKSEFQGNVLIGKVYHKTYMGSHMRYHIRVDDKETIFVDKRFTSGLPTYNVGEKIRVGWNIEDCLCFLSKK